MQSDFTVGYYTGANYPQYFKTAHWRRLKVNFIYSNPNARCWICEYDEDRGKLLPHHEIYNLFHEKLGRDIFILCGNCHTQVHFYKKFFIWKRKTPLKTMNLKRRRLHLRFEFCIQNKRYWSALSCLLQRSMT